MLAVLVGGLVVAGIAGARSGVFARDHARASTVQDALRRFRQGDRQARALEGVYSAATTGTESVDALGGARHRYPATTSLTALRTGCGLALEWRPLQDRADTWTLCSTPAGIELASSSEQHRFFFQSDTTTYRCSGALLLPADAGTPSAPRPFSCQAAKARLDGTAVSLGRVTLSVAGRSVVAEHVRTIATVSGQNQGTERTDWWLDTRTGLPVRVLLANRTSRKTIVGQAHYREDADLRLASLEPRR